MGSSSSKQTTPVTLPSVNKTEDTTNDISWCNIEHLNGLAVGTTARITYQQSSLPKKLTLTEFSDVYDKMEKKYNFHSQRVFITPQVGYNAGETYEWICSHPNSITLIDDRCEYSAIKTTKDKWSDRLTYFADAPTPQNTAQRVLLHIHQHQFESNTPRPIQYASVRRFDALYLRIPSILDADIYLGRHVTSDITQIIGHYLGIINIKLVFHPSNIFSSFSINVMLGMTFHEIMALIWTHLFIQYPSVTDLPPFHMTDRHGIRRIHDLKMRMDQQCAKSIQHELHLSFSPQILDSSMNPYKSTYLILNMVGVGFKMVDNMDVNKNTMQDLVDVYIDSVKGMDDDIGVLHMYLYEMQWSHMTRVDMNGKYAKKTVTRGYNDTDFDKDNLWPKRKEKECIFVDYCRYEMFKQMTLKEAGIDENGLMINIYNVTGPCVAVSPSWIKEEVIFFPSYWYVDVNLKWHEDAFHMFLMDKTKTRCCMTASYDTFLEKWLETQASCGYNYDSNIPVTLGVTYY
eukprot:257800_1